MPPLPKNPKKDRRLDTLADFPVFTTAEAIQLGVSQPTLSRMVERGELIRLEHGVFQNPAAPIDPADVDLAIACARFGPTSAIGGLTALFRFGLIDEVPDRIWLIVAPSVRSPSKRYRIIRSNHDPNIEIEPYNSYRMTSLERTLMECLKYKNKMGEGLALSAIRRAIATRRTNLKKLYQAAQVLGLNRTLEAHWEAINAA